MDSRYFSKNSKAIIPNAIRALMKYANKPGIISLSGGYPDPSFYPDRIIKKAVTAVLKFKKNTALGYGFSHGEDETKLFFKKYLLQKNGIKASLDNLLITTGSQQAVDLICRTFIDQSNIVCMEEPVYPGAIQIIKSYRPKIIPIPMDQHGLNIDIFETKLKKLYKQNKKIKFLYTIPNFQNPSGICLAEKRRKKLITLARKYDFIIIEDDPYGELRYSGKKIRAIACDAKSHLKGGRILYLSSVSKILVPGFRIGVIHGEPGIIAQLILAKQCSDICTSPFCQSILSELGNFTDINDYLKDICKKYKKKRDIMIRAIQAHFPEAKTNWTNPEGGFFIWVTLPEKMNSETLFHMAIKKGVAFVPGKPFFISRDGGNTLRLAFSAVSNKSISNGIKLLTKAIKEY